jgi:hypothetical protein
MLPQAQSWLYQGPHNWLTGRLAGLHLFTQLPMEGEHRIGLGLFTTAVTAWTLWRLRRRPWWAVLALTTVSVLLLTTVHGRFSPWQLVMAVVPGANGIRAVGRIAAFLVVPGALALATLLQERRRWPALVVVAVCLAEQGQAVPDSYDKQAQRDEVAAVVRAVPPGCEAFFWAPREVPPFDEKTQLDAMWAALELGIPTVNGCSGNTPRGWDLMQHSLVMEGDEPRLRSALARWERDRGLSPGSVCFVTP